MLLAPQHSGILFDSFSESCNSREGSRQGRLHQEACTASVPATALQKTLTAAESAADMCQGLELAAASASLPHRSMVIAATEATQSKPGSTLVGSLAAASQDGAGCLADSSIVQAAGDSAQQQPRQRSTLIFKQLGLTFRHGVGMHA